MNSALLNTWTPILKALPDEEREQARQLIEKYGETHPASFIVELLKIFGIHGVYLQTIPKQVANAADYAKSQIEASVASFANLNERTRLELNHIASDLGRKGAEFGKVLEQATKVQVKASTESTTEIKARIQQEFEKQNLPALTACLKKIGEHSEKAVLIGKDTAAQLETIGQRCHDAVSELTQLRWKSAWTICASVCACVFVILGVLVYYTFRSHNERKLAQQIAQASFSIEHNREVFAELALANVALELTRSSDAATGKPIPGGFAVIIRDATGAEMREYKGTKAGLIFVNSKEPEDTIRHLKLQVDALIREANNTKKKVPDSEDSP